MIQLLNTIFISFPLCLCRLTICAKATVMIISQRSVVKVKPNSRAPIAESKSVKLSKMPTPLYPELASDSASSSDDFERVALLLSSLFFLVIVLFLFLLLL